MNRDEDHTDHLEGADDLARLRQLAQALPPREPEEAAWNAVLVRIHESVGKRRSRRPLWIILGGAAAAAILAVLLARSLWPTQTPVIPAVPRVVQPFPVADVGDVTIISMDARDVAALVVGELPVSGDLEFARPEDIHVIRCERCPHSGRWARLEQDGEVPMFVTAALDTPHE
jgi:hypothetical protein